MQNTVLRDMAPYNLIEVDQRLGESESNRSEQPARRNSQAERKAICSSETSVTTRRQIPEYSTQKGQRCESLNPCLKYKYLHFTGYVRYWDLFQDGTLSTLSSVFRFGGEIQCSACLQST
jgi:hypothetical protein